MPTGDHDMIFQNLVMILARYFRLWKTISKFLGKN